MGYVYSSEKLAGTVNSYSDTRMRVCIYRGTITRTQTSVSFNFGVRFIIDGDNYRTTNSVASTYNSIKKYASKSGGSTQIQRYTYYYAGTGTSDGYQNTTETLVYSYSNSEINKDTTSVNVSISAGWSDHAGTPEHSFTFSLPIDKYVSNPTAPTVTITNNGNNTFKFTVTPGDNGVNNDANGVSDTQYSIDGGTTWTNCTVTKSENENDYVNDISISGSDKSVQGRAKTKGTIVGTTSDWGYSSVTEVLYYTAPSEPANLDITSNKIKFTPKATYIFSWNASTAGTNNPVKDYTYEIYKNDTELPEVIGTTTDTEVDKTPSDLSGLSKGDIIKFRVRANGDNSTFNSSFSGYKQVTIVSSGVMYVRVSDTWKEGQVYIRDSNDVWHEASGVYVRDSNDDWKESS